MGSNSALRMVAALACCAISFACVAGTPERSPGRSAGSKDIERGRYLVMITGCNDCHTQGFLAHDGNIPEKDRLKGSTMGWRGSWGTTYPVNLRIYFQEMTEEQWVQVAKEMTRRPPMPFFSLNALTDADSRAIYRYIHSLGTAGKPAPKFIEPGKEPPQPYVLWPEADK